MAQWKCSRARSISTVCSLKQNLKAQTSGPPEQSQNSISYQLAATVMDALIGDDLAVRSALISQRRRNEARSWGWITGYTTKAP